jgi:hypothetical protein
VRWRGLRPPGRAELPAPHACCGRTFRRHETKPRSSGRFQGLGTRGRDCAENPRVLVPCSPWATLSSLNFTLRSSIGEGCFLPATVRQTHATGKGLISLAQTCVAGLTLCATSPGDVPRRLRDRGLVCAYARLPGIAGDLLVSATGRRGERHSAPRSRSWRKKSSSSCISCSGLKASSRRWRGASSTVAS